jgi:hypothetical protein
MRYVLLYAALLLTSIANASGGETQDLETPLNYEEISPLIYQGTKSLPDEFPAMGWIGNCTGTLVAKNVIFTAAHCVYNGKRITFAHRGSGENYGGTCTRHPNVNTRNWFNDYAFCKLDEMVEGAVMATFKAETPKVGADLLLNGLGAPNVRVHYWGKADVSRNGTQDITTCGPANLGGGDSGGSLLEWTDDRSGKSGFYVVGVNSRGGGGCSYFNRINHPNFLSFAKEYEADKGVELCGVGADCSGETPPPPPPSDCGDEFRSTELAAELLGEKADLLAACLSSKP